MEKQIISYFGKIMILNKKILYVLGSNSKTPEEIPVFTYQW